jgi:putative flippase GtrA
MVSAAALALELAVLQAALSAHLWQPVAISCGYLTSAVFQFCALRFVVFKVAHRNLSIQAFGFVAGQIALWGMLVLSVALLTHIFPLNTMQARLICVPTLFPINYLVSKFLIFKK